jgi:carboxyl-terminal processing protease
MEGDIVKRIISIIVISGLLLVVAFYALDGSKLWAAADDIKAELQKFTYILHSIRDIYVEEPDMNKLIDGAIDGMLKTLDPHSAYINSEEEEKITEQFQGKFEGIGISFVIQNKWITVVSPIPGTPSDRLGIRAGDRIVEIEGQSAYDLTNEQVMLKLRGPKGTHVNVTIQREGEPEQLYFDIERAEIPIYSVETSFMLDNNTGYILINRFTATTNEELETALDSLEALGMNRLILDLRNNSGGYLDAAVEVADKFIPGGKLIVYTRGRIPRSNEERYSTDAATHPMYPLIVLINSGSASASEIVAGAIQDLDRGLIVGQTSFGKGYVQTELKMQDKSAVRITTARYYTPSGRLIQRPHDKGLAQYFEDIPTTEEEAEQDTTRPAYYTASHRKVYGGGGITPDVWVDPEYLTRLTSQILNQRLILEYANQYLAEHPNPPSDFPRFLSQFQITNNMMRDFLGLLAPKYGRMLSQTVKRDRDFMDYRSMYERSWEMIQDLTSAAVYQLADSVRVSIPADSLRIHFKEKTPMSEVELSAFKELITSKTKDAMQHDFKRDRDFLTNLIKAELARIWYNGQTYYYQVRVQDDNQVAKAETLFDQARQIAGLPKEVGQYR